MTTIIIFFRGTGKVGLIESTTFCFILTMEMITFVVILVISYPCLILQFAVPETGPSIFFNRIGDTSLKLLLEWRYEFNFKRKLSLFVLRKHLFCLYGQAKMKQKKIFEVVKVGRKSSIVQSRLSSWEDSRSHSESGSKRKPLKSWGLWWGKKEGQVVTSSCEESHNLRRAIPLRDPIRA